MKSLSSEEEWYDVVEDNNIFQGDLLRNFPTYIIPDDITESKKIIEDKFDVVVLNQSCDIKYTKLKNILLAPYITLTKLKATNKNYEEDPEAIEAIKRGYNYRLCMLNKCNVKDFEEDFIIVDFTKVYSMPLSLARVSVTEMGSRLRLKSPYRERLSQSFAIFIMRVALPSDLPKFADRAK